jgi:hypothetical protein
MALVMVLVTCWGGSLMSLRASLTGTQSAGPTLTAKRSEDTQRAPKASATLQSNALDEEEHEDDDEDGSDDAPELARPMRLANDIDAVAFAERQVWVVHESERQSAYVEQRPRPPRA